MLLSASSVLPSSFFYATVSCIYLDFQSKTSPHLMYTKFNYAVRERETLNSMSGDSASHPIQEEYAPESSSVRCVMPTCRFHDDLTPGPLSEFKHSDVLFIILVFKNSVPTYKSATSAIN